MILRTATDIGALIRDSRRRAGLSQAALAERIGTTQPWVSEIERGKGTAEIGMILRVLATLDIQLSGKRAMATAEIVHDARKGPAPDIVDDLDLILKR